jgi:hypothetical protein
MRHRRVGAVAWGAVWVPSVMRAWRVYALGTGNLRDSEIAENRSMDTNSATRINQVCSAGKGSVPRGRVYANYASRCATERTTVLNPASFGKLVRVLFPGLKTRRLGVRGESKYHYVNFQLTDDGPEVAESSAPALSFPDPARFSQNARYVTLLSARGYICADIFSPDTQSPSRRL